jgi:phage portal protein BeeE
VGLLDRISASRELARRDESRFSVDQYLADYLLPANQFTYNSNVYPLGINQTLVNDRTREISSTLPGYLNALRTCPPAYAAQMVRAMVLSQARFIFRNNRLSRTPGRLFGTSALSTLEKPWTNATTGELLARMEWHAGLAGNAYVTNRPIRVGGSTVDRLRVLRPDWVMIVYGSQQEPEDAAYALDGEVIGYAYCNGGIAQARNRVITLLPDEVAHWSPVPDPEHAGIGMSWITPAIREIRGDIAATDHKLKYFQNGATPNMVVKGITAANPEQFEEIVDKLETRHAGVRNAYKTWYLSMGADVSVVGANLKDIDLKGVNGSSETRISMLSRVHPTILGASEGLSGSSLNAGNFSSARRMWADSWIYPTLQDIAAALAPLVNVPADAELWTTTEDMPILREDAKDAADIENVKASTVVALINGGFTPQSSIDAVKAQDISLLKHTGLISVQLQPPGAPPPGKAPTDGAPSTPDGGGGTAPADTAPKPQARDESRKFNPAEARIPGGKGGGRWTKGGGGGGASTVDKLFADAVQGRDAIDAVPVKLGHTGFERTPDSAAHLSAMGFEAYRHGDDPSGPPGNSGFYRLINGPLRTGTLDQHPEIKPYVQAMDAVFEHSKLTKPLLVNRGVQDVSYVFPGVDTSKSLVGMRYVEKAPMSTSADPLVSEEYFDPASSPNGAMMKILVPPGVGAVAVSDFGPPPPKGQKRPESHEAEITLERDREVQIVKDYVDSQGIRRIEGVVVTPETIAVQDLPTAKIGGKK